MSQAANVIADKQGEKKNGKKEKKKEKDIKEKRKYIYCVYINWNLSTYFSSEEDPISVFNDA